MRRWHRLGLSGAALEGLGLGVRTIKSKAKAREVKLNAKATKKSGNGGHVKAKGSGRDAFVLETILETEEEEEEGAEEARRSRDEMRSLFL